MNRFVIAAHLQKVYFCVHPASFPASDLDVRENPSKQEERQAGKEYLRGPSLYLQTQHAEVFFCRTARCTTQSMRDSARHTCSKAQVTMSCHRRESQGTRMFLLRALARDLFANGLVPERQLLAIQQRKLH